MKAMIAKNGILQAEDKEVPVPKENEILIKLKSAAVNRTDILNRKSSTSYANMPVLGVEAAGIVVESGADATIKKGTRVMGLVNGGAYAEYAVMPADRAMIIPDTLSFQEAAAIPEVFLTAFQTLFWLGKLQTNESVLIHAGGSGVGTAAIQLAKQLRNAKVFTTAGSAEKLDVCRQLGADTLINYKDEKFHHVIHDATSGQGVDVILDFIGASYWDKNYASISVEGRWVLIGLLGGNMLHDLNLMDLMKKRIQLTGTLLTPRSDQYKAELTAAFSKEALHLFETKQLKPIIDRTFPLEEVQQAHEHMEANKNIGKIILSVEK